MLTDDRHALILRELQHRGSLNVSELAARIGVSGMTLRRDLATLEDRGSLQRVHGGAVPVAAATVGGNSQHHGGPGGAPQQQRARGRARTAPGVRMPIATIGMVVPSASYYFPSVIRGAEAAARDLGVRLVLAISNYSQMEEQRQIERLLANGVDGLLVTPSGESLANSNTLKALSLANVPVVIAERPIDDVLDDVALESVRSDHVRGAEIAINHLIGLGHHDIGLCVRQSSPTAVRVLKGYRLALERAGMECRDSSARFITVDRDQPEALREQIEELVGWVAVSKFTAVLVLNDEDALTFVDCCHERGISIPGDLAVVAYDDEIASMGAVPLTAVAPPKFDVGYQALQMCLNRIGPHFGNATALQQVSLSPSLIVRESSEP
ncbi:GntR family transcriptional regulator [Arthrobacter alpinus]|uniref:substrate-binding domain-containing protein n=1 Tax=Arthrobacter alpinus TaxID=656366 RepID=UPI0005C8FE1F|nr:substrate-binding domain-containing protein [Arthrobacter alpinus]ALV45082.1 GntR family transcriptional regulator [Arthrobacter alpinus]